MAGAEATWKGGGGRRWWSRWDQLAKSLEFQIEYRAFNLENRKKLKVNFGGGVVKTEKRQAQLET